MHVLVVNGWHDVRGRVVERVRQIRGIDRISETDSASDALSLLAEEQPDLVLLEMRLTEGHGFDVVDALHPLRSKPIVVVLTSFPYALYRRKCEDAGLRHFYDVATQLDDAMDVVSRLASLSKPSTAADGMDLQQEV